MSVYDKSKFYTFFLWGGLLLCSSTQSYFLLLFYIVLAFTISIKKVKILICAGGAVFLFSFLTAFANALLLYYLYTITDFSHLILFVLRSFALTYLVLACVDRWGVVTLFGITPFWRLFMILFLAKKEFFSQMLAQTYACAISKGMHIQNLTSTMKLISSVSVTLYIKALELSQENTLALRSRGFYGSL